MNGFQALRALRRCIAGALCALGALGALGFDGVGHVRQGKVFDLELEGADKAKAEADLKAMCDKLLANTVIENYTIALS